MLLGIYAWMSSAYRELLGASTSSSGNREWTSKLEADDEFPQ